MKAKQQRLIKQFNIPFGRCFAVSIIASIISNSEGEEQNAQLIYLEYWENQMMAKKIAQMLDAGYDSVSAQRCDTSRIWTTRVKRKAFVIGIQNQTIIKRMSSVTVIIVTCSPHKEIPSRDNDNADGHDIINIIRDYLMCEDDSGLYMNVFYDTRISDHYYTEVYVLPRQNYREILRCFQPQKEEKKTRVYLKKEILIKPCKKKYFIIERF